MVQHVMRRKDRETDTAEAMELLKCGEYGVMAMVDTNGEPYAVPLSYILEEGAIYFHCAKVGRKIDALKFNPKVCFTVVGTIEAVYDKSFSTYYESVVVFGHIIEIEDFTRKTEFLMCLTEKYLPAHVDKATAEIAKSLECTSVYCIQIEKCTGKAKKRPY